MLTYRDAYLKKFATQELEDIASEDVALLNGGDEFDTEWQEKLTVIRLYILACLENQADETDLFTAKLRTYNKEFEGLIAKARTASPDSEGNMASIFSIPLERA